MTPAAVLERVERLFAERGGSEYHGEAVTQLEHALQAAHFAERDGNPTLIVAALLHDVGHLLHGHGEDYLDRAINDRHEELGARFLAHAFGPAVTEPIRLHVPAKRYLASGVHPDYPGLLSAASLRSLELQGGPMTAAQANEFEAHPHFGAAVAVRMYDDRAKLVGLVTPPFAHFRKYLETCLRADPA